VWDRGGKQHHLFRPDALDQGLKQGIELSFLFNSHTRSSFAVELAANFIVAPQTGPACGALKRPADTQNLLETGFASAFSTHFAVSAGDFNRVQLPLFTTANLLKSS